jgi:hypothetical protein
MKRKKDLPSGRIERFEFIYSSLANGIRAPKSKAPKEWLAKKGLSYDVTGACFNSGQIHHRRDQAFKKGLADIGFLFKSNVGVNCNTTPYTVFGIFSIMFPLKNLKNEIVNFYCIRIRSDKTAYMNSEGLYPGYPHELTKKLFVVNTILDAATLLESKILDNREAVLALHEGEVMSQQIEAIKRLTKLQEIIYIDSQSIKHVSEKAVWTKTKK